MKRVQLNLKVPEPVVEKLRQLAEQNHLNVTAYVIQLIMNQKLKGEK